MSNKTVPQKGNIKKAKEILGGPLKVYLESGETDENGHLVMEEYTDFDGSVKERPKRQPEPFMDAVYYRKNYMTIELEEELKQRRDDKSLEDKVLLSGAYSLQNVIAKWDLNDDGVPIKPTVEDIKKFGVPSDIIWATLNAYYEASRPPKELSEKSQNTSLPEASTEDSQESTE